MSTAEERGRKTSPLHIQPTTASSKGAPETPERLLNIAASSAPKSNAPWRKASMPWAGLLLDLDLANPADHQECGGGYVPGLFCSSKRSDEYFVSRSVLTLDADEAKSTFLADVARVLPGVAAAAHTTWSHGVKGDRWRLLVPLSRDVDADEYRRLHERVRDALGDHWGVDKGCPSPVQFMWRPSTQNNDTYVSHVQSGELLDVDTWSQDEPQRRDETPRAEKQQQVAAELHPWAKAAIDGELARLDACEMVGVKGWDTTTFEVACKLIEFANNPRSGYTLDQAEADLLDRAPSDEGCVRPGDDGFGPKEHAEKWANALKKVGGKRRAIPGDDDFDAADELDAVVKTTTELDVSNMAKAAEWLRREVGRQGAPLAGLFRRGGGMVHTPRIGEDGYIPLVDDEHSEDGPAQVRSVDAAQLRARVNFRYEIHKFVGKDKERVDATFPADAATLVYNAVDLAPNLRPLAGVTHTPMLRKDGSVLSEEGYDEASARLYLPEPGMTVLPVPDVPTADEVRAAHDLISKMIADFPFNTDHDRANYLALLFTPLVRVVVPPPYPLGLIHAHQPGSGKGYLAMILRTLHGGALRPLPGNNEEFRKQILSILAVTTAPVVQFDNVNRLESTALDALLTTDTWSDRPLGVTADVTGKNDRLWIATGNNVGIGGDLLRRIRWVNIDPNTPNPEQRTGFAIADLPAWVRDHRGELLTALLTLLRAWVVAGKPHGPKVGSDDFSKWNEAMQGVLGVAGWPGTVGHVETIQQDSNDDDSEWATFLAAALEWSKGKPWTVKDMMTWVDTDSLPSGMSGKSVGSVGMWMKNRKGRWAGGYVLRSAGLDKKVHRWQVEEV